MIYTVPSTYLHNKQAHETVSSCDGSRECVFVCEREKQSNSNNKKMRKKEFQGCNNVTMRDICYYICLRDIICCGMFYF